MSFYGFAITDKGRALITKLLAGADFELSRIMVGSGKPEYLEKMPREMTDLAQPIAAATSTVPVCDGESFKMVVEYRSDLNGGLEEGFWLNEFGIYAFDPDEGEVLVYYGSLGDYPQWVSAASKSAVDVRRFPVVIIVGTNAEVKTDYTCEAWMTAEDVSEFCSGVILPQFLEEARKLIGDHNADVEAHYSLQNLVTELNSRLSLLELRLNTDVDGNTFSVTFESTDGVTIREGVLNINAQRLEF